MTIVPEVEGERHGTAAGLPNLTQPCADDLPGWDRVPGDSGVWPREELTGTSHRRFSRNCDCNPQLLQSPMGRDVPHAVVSFLPPDQGGRSQGDATEGGRYE